MNSRDEVAGCSCPTKNDGYAHPVATSQDIRRANLRFLLEECAEDIGSDRGAQAELAKRTGVPAPQISQFLNKKMHQGGEVRSLGDEGARKLERGMDKPTGWLDVDSTVARDFREAAMLDKIRELTDEQKSAVLALLSSFKP